MPYNIVGADALIRPLINSFRRRLRRSHLPQRGRLWRSADITGYRSSGTMWASSPTD